MGVTTTKISSLVETWYFIVKIRVGRNMNFKPHSSVAGESAKDNIFCSFPAIQSLRLTWA